MIPVTLHWVASHVDGVLVDHTTGALKVKGNVVIDSRQLNVGDLFIAIKGPNFDGHDFIEAAEKAGACAVICDREVSTPLPQIRVRDTRRALGDLAAAVKADVAPRTVAITGSSGKTTVKEMVAAILQQAESVHGEVLATQGNFNNDIGVPLTLLRLTQNHTHAVIELGANHRGEIAYTTGLVKPDAAMINNVAPAHVEGFGDICGVAKAKTEIFRGVPEGGLVLTNSDSEFHEYWLRELDGRNHRTFGIDNSEADLRATDIQINQEGCAQFTLHAEGETHRIQLTLPGKHNVMNALAAVAMCRALGLSFAEIVRGFGKMQAVPGRMVVHKPVPGVQLIDDTYNANVGSAKAAIDVLASLPGRRLFVFGDMGELGANARAYHEEVGAYAISAGIDGLFTLGVLSQSASEIFNGHGGRHFDSIDAVVDGLLEEISQHPEITILVKGSRSSRMERIVESLLAANLTTQRRGKATC
ncbi:UDP-N-acetylmuramoyl-tripeptide--D-alanyl-D-alanine ligase [Aliidiomarina halalkaliphila]|uniref:UDP-N-acetylmuramoyl-tripeptide--D-alanyl-D-alanine ligase n=1 Tax=Aliidiomarina halalkaliphila TaxID=2593535 RepID=A0A552X5V7_9GAMM|nr:UDP-N-acetylmuramoyl-tripeptide--D-alanyl-D-alanine ligase [Aliidiomarina halalkaliphila]TRW50411.1 UDP-N-acetylmuramoyl-tripeptide--D-alanyl-D-alanine ligase [Aliidiomarina halalkaliphila]